MDETWAVIPVKILAQGKSRLAGVLDGSQRARLTQRMLARLLHELAALPQITKTVVVTRDAQAAQIAAAHGVETLAEPAGVGLNGALMAGRARVRRAGGAWMLILPSDLPLATAVDVAAVLATADGRGVVICGDERQTGTNALLLPTAVSFRFQYGPDSLRRHVAEARRLQLPLTIVDNTRLRFDLDTPQDWQRYCQWGPPLLRPA